MANMKKLIHVPIARILWLSTILFLSCAVFIINPAQAQISVGIGSDGDHQQISGRSFNFTYRWSGGRTPADYRVFVHMLNASKQIVFQDDHTPSVRSSQWANPYSYIRSIAIPASVASGAYEIRVGMLDQNGNRIQLAQRSGAPVDDQRRYLAGTINVLPAVVESAQLSASSIVRGNTQAVTYRFSAGKLPTNARSIFVHFLNSDGSIAFGDDHTPANITSWSGAVVYQRQVQVPSNLAAGQYRVAVGMLDSIGNRVKLMTGSGVSDMGSNRYQVGSFQVTTQPIAQPTPAPTPPPVVSNGATIETANLSSSSIVRGNALGVTYRFNASNMPANARSVFVHFLNSSDQIVWGDDHTPPSAMSAWNGSISYQRQVNVPSSVATGSYRVAVGLLDANGNRLSARAGSGVTDLGSSRFQVASLQVTTQPVANPSPTPAPPPVNNDDLRGRNIYRVVDYGARCNGSADDADAIQRAFNALPNGAALEFPRGTCNYSKQVMLNGKTNVVVYGFGMNTSIIRATTQTSSAFTINRGDRVKIRDMALVGANTRERISYAAARGIYFAESSNVTITGTRVENVSGSGITFWRVNTGTVLNNFVKRSWADGFHITGSSSNFVVSNNLAEDTGDDGFASIGYGSARNSNMEFTDNTSIRSHASGVSSEGTENHRILRNTVIDSGVAGIRIASVASYSTGRLNQIRIENNIVRGARTRSEVGHAAVMIFAAAENISNVFFNNNRIENPRTDRAFQIYGSNPWTVNTIDIRNTTITDTNNRLNRCITVGSRVSNLSTGGNTFKGGACNVSYY